MPWIDERRLERLETKLDAVLELAREAVRSGHRIEQTERTLIMATLDDILAETTSQKTLVDSVVTMIAGLHDQLTQALASNDPAKVQAALDAIKANDTALAEAIAANTPAAPTT